MVHAAGMPKSESDTRSHFESETNWEFGSASYSVTNGFLGRFLQGQPGVDRLPGIGRGSNLQRSLEGPIGSLSMNSISSFNVGGYANNTQARTVLDKFYEGGTGDLLMQTGKNTISAIGSVTGINWAAPQYQPQNGAVYGTDDLSRNLKETAMLIRGNLGLRAVAIDFGGWDTHDAMGMPEDPASWFRNRATTLANALQSFYTDLGTSMDEVTLFTVSEFGRTIDENGSGGTDHGRGNVHVRARSEDPGWRVRLVRPLRHRRTRGGPRGVERLPTSGVGDPVGPGRRDQPRDDLPHVLPDHAARPLRRVDRRPPGVLAPSVQPLGSS